MIETASKQAKASLLVGVSWTQKSLRTSMLGQWLRISKEFKFQSLFVPILFAIIIPLLAVCFFFLLYRTVKIKSPDPVCYSHPTVSCLFLLFIVSNHCYQKRTRSLAASEYKAKIFDRYDGLVRVLQHE